MPNGPWKNWRPSLRRSGQTACSPRSSSTPGHSATTSRSRISGRRIAHPTHRGTGLPRALPCLRFMPSPWRASTGARARAPECAPSWSGCIRGSAPSTPISTASATPAGRGLSTSAIRGSRASTTRPPGTPRFRGCASTRPVSRPTNGRTSGTAWTLPCAPVMRTMTATCFSWTFFAATGMTSRASGRRAPSSSRTPCSTRSSAAPTSHLSSSHR
jgi:hypothetical protein